MDVFHFINFIIKAIAWDSAIAIMPSQSLSGRFIHDADDDDADISCKISFAIGEWGMASNVTTKYYFGN